MAFPGATIDAVTIAGRREAAAADHAVRVVVPELAHAIPQREFRENPRCTFNLFLTADKRALVRRLAALPRLGDFFAPHEGIHSGNMRDELFVERAVDASCRPLLFGRDELAPYTLTWAGRWVRLGAFPARRGGARYANLGKRAWHEGAKLIVRRTGDRVTAAVDNGARYASNNFFVVVPVRPCALTLDGLAALLNSRFMTSYFRTIEPRQGRAFAELKIKHLVDFPLPPPGADCGTLNALGARRRVEGPRLDDAIEAEVASLVRAE
jgi:hypothetical protein